jgi:hypothetical protein
LISKLENKHYAIIAFVIAAVLILLHAKLSYQDQAEFTVAGTGAEFLATAWA